MEQVTPALEAAGGRYLARGGALTAYEGDWHPPRIVLLEFPSQHAWESFHYSAEYEGIKSIRDDVSSGRMIGVEGLPPGVSASASRLTGRARYPTDHDLADRLAPQDAPV